MGSYCMDMKRLKDQKVDGLEGGGWLGGSGLKELMGLEGGT